MQAPWETKKWKLQEEIFFEHQSQDFKLLRGAGLTVRFSSGGYLNDQKIYTRWNTEGNVEPASLPSPAIWDTDKKKIIVERSV